MWCMVSIGFSLDLLAGGDLMTLATMCTFVPFDHYPTFSGTLLGNLPIPGLA